MTIYTDDFNRAAIGTNWTNVNPAWGSVQIVSNTVVSASASNGSNEAIAYYNASAVGADQEAEITIGGLDFLSGNFSMGVACRVSADLNGARAAYFAYVAADSAGPNYLTVLGKVVNGARSVLHSASVAWANGNRLKLRVVADTLTVYKDDVALGGLFTQTDPDLTTGQPGICANGSAPTGDDWAGGDAVAGGITVNPATETDSAQPITRAKARAIAPATETDAAQALTLIQASGITFVGGAVGVTTATLPAFNVGDIAIVFAFRDGNTTNPAVPGTFTTITNTTDGTSCSVSMGWRRLQAGDTTVGTWTNANRVSVVVYRGMRPSGTPVGAFAAGAASTSNTLDYPAITLTATNGTSWVLRCAGHRSVDQNLETPPSGYINRGAASGVDATAETAAHDTNGPVSSATAANVTLTGTASGRIPITLELLSKIIGGPIQPALETDSAQPITRAKRKAAGIASETDSAPAIAAQKTRALSPALETDSAITIAHSGATTITIGPALETDSAQPVGRAKAEAVLPATETDAAQALTRQHTRAAGPALESDSAQPLARAKAKAILPVTETDSAQALARRKSRAAGAALETDTAQPLVAAKLRAISPALETDSAQPITRAAVQAITYVPAANRPRPGRGPFSTGRFYVRDSRTYHLPQAPVLSFAIGAALETDSAQPITRAKRKAVGVAAETDAAQPIARAKRKAAGIAAETDSAQVIGRAKSRPLNAAIETDSAQPVSNAGSTLITLNPALESDAALPLAHSKQRLAAFASEIDAAPAFTRVKARPLVSATETDSALAFARRKTRLLSPALELDSAIALSLSGGYSASPSAYVLTVKAASSSLRVHGYRGTLNITP